MRKRKYQKRDQWLYGINPLVSPMFADVFPKNPCMFQEIPKDTHSTTQENPMLGALGVPKVCIKYINSLKILGNTYIS